MPANKTVKKTVRIRATKKKAACGCPLKKGVYTISAAVTKCAQKLGAKGGRATQRKRRKARKKL